MCALPFWEKTVAASSLFFFVPGFYCLFLCLCGLQTTTILVFLCGYIKLGNQSNTVVGCWACSCVCFGIKYCQLSLDSTNWINNYCHFLFYYIACFGVGVKEVLVDASLGFPLPPILSMSTFSDQLNPLFLSFQRCLCFLFELSAFRIFNKLRHCPHQGDCTSIHTPWKCVLKVKKKTSVYTFRTMLKRLKYKEDCQLKTIEVILSFKAYLACTNR